MKLFLLLFSVVLLQCKTKNPEAQKNTDAAKSDSPVNTTDTSVIEAKIEEAKQTGKPQLQKGASKLPALIIKPDAKKTARLNYNIDTAFVTSTTLYVSVSYSGGCKEHEFKLFGDGAVSNNTTQIYIDHENNGDVCRKMIQQDLQYDISSLGKEKRPITIVLNGKRELILE